MAGPGLSVAEVLALYKKAAGYFNSASPTPTTDSLALSFFDRIIREAGTDPATQKVLIDSYVNKGILLDVKGSYAQALASYTGALTRLNGAGPANDPHMSANAPRVSANDSLTFRVTIYAGTDYYQLDNFDSANLLLNTAERLAERSRYALPEKDRLYNALGALYYESGNYLQAKDYFTRALEITQKDRPADKISAMNFKNNIAGSQYKLGLYAQALEMYNSLLRFGIASPQLYFNIGKCEMGLADYPKALASFRKVDPLKLPVVYNELGYVQFLLKKYDSALAYLDKWPPRGSGTQQSRTDTGINVLYRAELLAAGNRPDLALLFVQKAIGTFSGSFTNPDIHTNPQNFTGSFGSYKLFEALSYKARLLKTLYDSTGKEEYLTDALAAYKSAIGLFRYIEKTYTSDDAKLFLKKNNRDLYENAVLICLALDRLQPGGPYRAQAFELAEKSKASIVAASVDQMASARVPGVDAVLAAQQKALRYKIARLELHTDPERGRTMSPEIASEKAGLEIQLSFLQKKLEQNSSYYNLKFADTIPSVTELQQSLTDDQAIVSLFVSAKGLHVFVIGRNFFKYLLLAAPPLDAEVRRWIGLLTSTEPGQRFGDRSLEASLVRDLVRPLQDSLQKAREWVIIPDGIYDQLPFESLPADDRRHALIETTTIGYQLSAKFLAAAYQRSRDAFSSYSVLAFAPFAEGGGPEVLPASGEEIAGLPGKQFLNTQATKTNFLKELNHYPVIHLATHALSDPEGSEGSRIFFYPRHKTPEEDNLFLPELYSLGLDSTDLVILSACEGGKGELVGNEGVISLSRGFMYAGCASTVTSLWKADDASTAIILRKFHVYLGQGLSKSVALRKAKLDYIHSKALHVTPNYWAHLILIGNPEPVVKQKNKGTFMLLVYCGILVVLCTGVLTIWRVRSNSRDRSSR